MKGNTYIWVSLNSYSWKRKKVERLHPCSLDSSFDDDICVCVPLSIYLERERKRENESLEREIWDEASLKMRMMNGLERKKFDQKWKIWVWGVIH